MLGGCSASKFWDHDVANGGGMQGTEEGQFTHAIHWSVSCRRRDRTDRMTVEQASFNAIGHAPMCQYTYRLREGYSGAF